MPTLNWLGKDKVVNYSAQVPFHVLDKIYNFGNSQNKIIHGDNLLALKSLLPIYEGKIKCIYIDPPYNTGITLILRKFKNGSDKLSGVKAKIIPATINGCV